MSYLHENDITKPSQHPTQQKEAKRPLPNILAKRKRRRLSPDAEQSFLNIRENEKTDKKAEARDIIKIEKEMSAQGDTRKEEIKGQQHSRSKMGLFSGNDISKPVECFIQIVELLSDLERWDETKMIQELTKLANSRSRNLDQNS